MERSQQQITTLLERVRDGSVEAREALASEVYDELRRIARRHMRREAGGHTLQPTALVNEAYLRLIDQPGAWNGRSHFFAVAAQMMRRLLVDHARARLADKRGGGAMRVELKEEAAGVEVALERALAVDQALAKLERFDLRQGRIVELRYFGGLTDAEIAQVLGVSVRTVRGDWQMAKAWLYGELGGGDAAFGPQ